MAIGNNLIKATRIAKDYLAYLRKHKGIISVVQIGSSLRKDDFMQSSDIDFLVIYDKNVRKMFKISSRDGIEINLVRRGKKQFIKSLADGIPIDLMALKYGKILHDTGFFKRLRVQEFKPTVKTGKLLMRSALFNLEDAAMNYFFPACLCCYFKSLHHSAREFCRLIIFEHWGEVVEGNKEIIRRLSKCYPNLCANFRLIINGRKNDANFKERYISEPKIVSYGTGRYLLAAEEIARCAFKIVANLKVPKINDLISELQKKYSVESFHSFYILIEERKVMLNLILTEKKAGIFMYDLEKERFSKTIIR